MEAAAAVLQKAVLPLSLSFDFLQPVLKTFLKTFLTTKRKDLKRFKNRLQAKCSSSHCLIGHLVSVCLVKRWDLSIHPWLSTARPRLTCPPFGLPGPVRFAHMVRVRALLLACAADIKIRSTNSEDKHTVKTQHYRTDRPYSDPYSVSAVHLDRKDVIEFTKKTV